MSISPFSKPSYTLPNFRRNGFSSLSATGELTQPATVTASYRSNKVSARLVRLWYTAFQNSLIFVLLTHYFYQQVPLLVKVRRTLNSSYKHFILKTNK